MVIVVPLLIFFVIGGFFCFTTLNKVIFIGYLCYLFYEWNQHFGEGFHIYKLLMGGVALYIFQLSISLAETKEGKIEVAKFFIKYGGAYVLMVLLIKLALFASAGFDKASWEGIDMLITLLPYKWVLFIILLAIFNSRK